VEDQVMGAYSYGYARVRAESSNYFYIDRAGRRAFGREFPEAGRFSEGLAVVKDPDTGLYGYLDTDGAYVIPPALAEASDFSEGRAAVRMQDGKWAYIDRRGDISTVFPATDHSPVLTAYSSGYAIVVLGPGRSGVIDRSGRWIWMMGVLVRSALCSLCAAGGGSGRSARTQFLSVRLPLPVRWPKTIRFTPLHDRAPFECTHQQVGIAK
jgi:hypothetical protein